MATFSVTHPNCGATRTIRINPGEPPVDFDAALDCIPGRGCCGQDHHHLHDGAEQCPNLTTGHEGVPCANTHVTPEDCTAGGTEPGVTCPGGHCGEGVDGCTNCRAIHIQVLDLGLQPVAVA
jgi:hypothetical protein